MEGVTTAIVAFIFVAMGMPSLIKHRAYFFTAFILVIIVMLLDALAHLGGGAAGFFYFMEALTQIAAVILVVCSAGGLSVVELKDELGQTIEVIRRGEAQKEVIVPLSA